MFKAGRGSLQRNEKTAIKQERILTNIPLVGKKTYSLDIVITLGGNSWALCLAPWSSRESLRHKELQLFGDDTPTSISLSHGGKSGNQPDFVLYLTFPPQTQEVKASGRWGGGRLCCQAKRCPLLAVWRERTPQSQSVARVT